ncbi:MAG TPA: hypothetical protein G4O13_05960 [Dehalococcoidia bacterium]|nr:hypothetical protein [Dehalococcoidia bacterium]
MKGTVVKKASGSAGAGRNSAKRGFYSRALDEAEELDFELAQGVEGIDDEIALLRVKIKSLLENDPENVKLIMDATSALARLVMTRYRISSAQKRALTDAIGKVLQGLAIPLGIKYLP